MELVTSMWRQDRLRGLELAVLTAAEQESPPSEATVRKLGTFARYGARIDKDIGRALQALRTLRNRPDAWLNELQDDTCEPGAADAPKRNFTNELALCTSDPKLRHLSAANCTNELSACTREPCLVDLWQGEGAPPLCRGVARGVGDRREPRVRARGSARSRPAFF
jgi:hypothetical protein